MCRRENNNIDPRIFDLGITVNVVTEARAKALAPEGVLSLNALCTNFLNF